MNASTAIEYPHVVLIAPASPELLRRAKTASGVEQFVPKRDLQLAIGTLDVKGGHQRVSIPPKAGHRRDSRLSANNFVSVSQQLVFDLQWTAHAHIRGLVAKRWLAVLDAHDTTLHRVSTRAESARLSIQYPFARKVGLFLSDP